MPPKRVKVWSETEIDPDVGEAYERTVRALADLKADKGKRGEPEPFSVRMTPEAKGAWAAFYKAWAREQAAVEGHLAACYSKLEGAAARLALIHHVVSRVHDLTDCDPIEPESVAAGAALARWFAREARRVYMVLTESADAGQVRRLVEWLRSRGGEATARQLHRASPTRYRTAEEADAALNALVEDGIAEWRDRPASAKGGRPARACVLVTRLTKDETDETPDDDDPDDDPGRAGGADESPDGTPPAGGIPQGKRGFVSSDNRQCENGELPHPGSSDGPAGEVSSAPPGVSSAPPGEDSTPEERHGTGPENRADTTDETHSRGGGWALVVDTEQLDAARAAVDETAVVGLDCETTGLDPRADRVRLLALDCETIDGGRYRYLIDCFAVDPSPLWQALAGRRVVMHNGAFDLQFLAALGFAPGAVSDTMLLSQLVYGTRQPRGFHTLAEAAARELGRTLDKAEQKGDWSGTLTAAQLEYAADAAVLLPLHEALAAKVKASGQEHAAAAESRCLPAVAWLSRSGASFDRPAWEALATEADAEARRLAARLDDAAPPRPGHLAMPGMWNWSSPQQVKEAFGLLGVSLESTDDDALAAVEHPLAALLREHRTAAKLVSTYGGGWFADALHAGRIFAGWRQVGADSGRMACASPNLQNLPRDAR
jgi:hypothetical protein